MRVPGVAQVKFIQPDLNSFGQTDRFPLDPIQREKSEDQKYNVFNDLAILARMARGLLIGATELWLQIPEGELVKAYKTVTMRIPTPIATGYLLIAALLLPTASFAQNVRTSDTKPVTAVTEKRSYIDFLTEVPTGNVDGTYRTEANRIAQLLAKGTKNVVLIDEHGFARDLVLGAATTQLASLKSDKHIYRINWASLFGTVKNDAELDAAMKDIVAYAEGSHGNVVIWLDDLSNFTAASPTLGRTAAAKLYAAVSEGQIQVLTASDNASFESQVVADSNLRSRFEKVAFKNEQDADPFVGDKLSADLKDLATGADKNRTVKVILQSDDLNDPQLAATLKKLNITVDSRAEALNMMSFDIPAGAAQEIASLRAAKHLSLDHKMSVLGHVETTTGATLADVLRPRGMSRAPRRTPQLARQLYSMAGANAIDALGPLFNWIGGGLALMAFGVSPNRSEPNTRVLALRE